MGAYGTDNALSRILRVSTSTPQQRDHFRKWAPFTDGDAHNEYALTFKSSTSMR
jgi:hypothetical protein